MIRYDSDLRHLIGNLAQLEGSVFATAAAIALPNALMAAFLFWVFNEGDGFTFFTAGKGILNVPAPWAAFTGSLGIVLVFRNGQAYSRWWEGISACNSMRCHMFDAATMTIALSKDSTRPDAELRHFRHLIVRLFSVLHAVAVADVEAAQTCENGMIHRLPVIDLAGLDVETLTALVECKCKVQLLLYWLQEIVVTSQSSGILASPPPMVSRVFAEIGSAVASYNQAMKLARNPFPFAYAQTVNALLVFHWLLTPILSSEMSGNAFWAAVFSFIQVFSLWAINIVAMWIEAPFGFDPNDVNGAELQEEINSWLIMLLVTSGERGPALSDAAKARIDADADDRRTSETKLHTYNSLLDNTLHMGEEPPRRTGPPLEIELRQHGTLRLVDDALEFSRRSTAAGSAREATRRSAAAPQRPSHPLLPANAADSWEGAPTRSFHLGSSLTRPSPSASPAGEAGGARLPR